MIAPIPESSFLAVIQRESRHACRVRNDVGDAARGRLDLPLQRVQRRIALAQRPRGIPLVNLCPLLLAAPSLHRSAAGAVSAR